MIITLLHVNELGEQFRMLLVSPTKLWCCCSAACPFEMSGPACTPSPNGGTDEVPPKWGSLLLIFLVRVNTASTVGQPGGSTGPGAPLFSHNWEWDYELQYRACGGTGELDKRWQMLAGQF